MDYQLTVDALRNATEAVFSTMLGLEVESGAPFIETKDPGPSQGVIGLIGLAGTWVGTVSICCDASMACQIASRMLDAEIAEVDEETLDAISEITNMIVGVFKTEAEMYLGPLGLSIPAVVYGLNFAARTAGKERWIVVPFTCEGQNIEIKICLTPNRGLPRLLSKPSRLAYQ